MDEIVVVESVIAKGCLYFYFSVLIYYFPGGRSVWRCQYWKRDQRCGRSSHLTGAGRGKKSKRKPSFKQQTLAGRRPLTEAACLLWLITRPATACNNLLKKKPHQNYAVDCQRWAGISQAFQSFSESYRFDVSVSVP